MELVCGGPQPDFAKHLQGDGDYHSGPPGGMGGPNRRDSSSKVAGHQQIGAVLSVSTAFLGSIAKSDNFAELWLGGNARIWLNSVANLTGN